MARGWYGLFLGDRVVYGFAGRQIEGTVIKLFASDKNAGVIIDDSGVEHKVVCEYCERIPPTNSILTFRPLKEILYTVLIFEEDDYHEVYSFSGEELEESVTRIIKNVGDEIKKIEIYVRENASYQLSLYQVIHQTDFFQQRSIDMDASTPDQEDNS